MYVHNNLTNFIHTYTGTVGKLLSVSRLSREQLMNHGRLRQISHSINIRDVIAQFMGAKAYLAAREGTYGAPEWVAQLLLDMCTQS